MIMIEILTVYSAFNIKISNNIYKELEQQSLLDIPDVPIFGLFITIIRSQVLDKWPIDIHGCLGYWKNDYTAMTKLEIIDKLKELAYDANYKDNRRNFFKSLQEDAGAKIEISFMLLPRLEILDGKVGNENFNNDKYGLIVESDVGRATYLPKVFHKIGWNDLRKSLMKKAGVNNGRFYGYRTKVIDIPIYDVLFSGESMKLLEIDIAKFYMDNYVSFIPYSVVGGSVNIERGESVRNLGCIGDVIKFSGLYDFGDKIGLIKNNLDYYWGEYEKNPELYRQASAFMLEDYYLLGGYNDRVKIIVNYLYDKLDRLEPRFELGEVLKILAIVEPRRAELDRQLKRMGDRLGRLDVKLDDVFELNWQAQFVREIGRKKHLGRILDLLLGILGRVRGELETNYLAVIYECLSNIGSLIGSKKLKNNRLDYFIKLNSRRGENGLYYFIGMKEARLDITGHVIFQP